MSVILWPEVHIGDVTLVEAALLDAHVELHAAEIEMMIAVRQADGETVMTQLSPQSIA